MADIKVERRTAPGWLAAALIAIAAVAIYLLLSMGMRPGPSGAEAPDGASGIAIRYEGHTWIPANVAQAATFPADEMVAVGERDGRTLWANRLQGLGGGGGISVPARLETGPYHRIYVKLDDGRYLPLVWQDAGPGGR